MRGSTRSKSGSGPRASENIVLAARARALLGGSTHVTADHVREVALPVLRHRIMTNFNAEADQVKTDQIVDGLLRSVTVESSSAAELSQMDEVLRP